MLSLKINGVVYSCVSSIKPNIKTEYSFNVTTLDGKTHRKFKGKKTNYTVVFFNDLQESFNVLKETLSGSNTVELTIPTTGGEVTATYYPTIKSYNSRGFLQSGVFFEDGLSVNFEKVEYDE